MSYPQNLLPEHSDDLSRRIRLLLSSRHVPGFRHIAVESQQGRVTLRGVLATYYQRQLALVLVRAAAGVTQVVDRLEVAPSAAAVAETASPDRAKTARVA